MDEPLSFFLKDCGSSLFFMDFISKILRLFKMSIYAVNHLLL